MFILSHYVFTTQRLTQFTLFFFAEEEAKKDFPLTLIIPPFLMHCIFINSLIGSLALSCDAVSLETGHANNVG
jgi:hypothetical protein